MDAFKFAIRCALMMAGATLSITTASAQSPPQTTSAGPGRITCRTITTCEVGIGTPAVMRYKIDASSLSDDDKKRLLSDCKVNAKPCVATVDGIDQGATKPIKATKIKWFN